MERIPSYRLLGFGLFALGAALALTSLLGPLAFGVIHYRVSELSGSQLDGVDAVSLVLVAPLSALIGLLAVRGDRAAPALALAPAGYSLYLVTETILGPDYLGIPGNNERYFPLFLTTFLLAGAVAVGAWNLIDRAQLSSLPRRRSRAVGGLLIGLAGFLTLGRYLPGLADAMRAEPSNGDYLAGPTIFWTVALEDLGVVIPVMVMVGLGMWRANPWVSRVAYAVIGWAALVPLTVAAMAVAMYVNDQPSASRAAIGLLSGMAAVFLFPAVVCYPPLFGSPHASQIATTEVEAQRSAA